MMRKHFRFKGLVLGIAFGLAIAGFSASAVRAEPASGNGPLDPWAYSLIHRSTQADVIAPAKYGPLDPWAYAVIHRDSSASVVSPDVRDVGFDWGDAGIGAAVSFGAALLLLSAVMLGLRYRRRIDPSGLATDAL